MIGRPRMDARAVEAVIVAAIAALLALIVLTSCDTMDPVGDRFPYDGPLVDADGNPVRPPSWTNSPAGWTNRPATGTLNAQKGAL